jgi:hypothetical protein
MMSPSEIFMCSQMNRFKQNLRMLRATDPVYQKAASRAAENIIHEIKGAAAHCDLHGQPMADDLYTTAQFADYLLANTPA